MIMKHMGLRADCNCPECKLSGFKSRMGAIPQVSSRSGLMLGFGQDDSYDDSSDIASTDDTSADTSTDDTSADTSTDDTSADTSTDDTSADTSTDDTSADTSTDDTSTEAPQQVDQGSLSASDIAKIAASGLELTAEGIKTAMALGIIKRPMAVSQMVQQASASSPDAAAQLAIRTGKSKSSSPIAISKALPIVILGGLGVLILLKRKK
jgi:hypothetical protein